MKKIILLTVCLIACGQLMASEESLFPSKTSLSDLGVSAEQISKLEDALASLSNSSNLMTENEKKEAEKAIDKRVETLGMAVATGQVPLSYEDFLKMNQSFYDQREALKKLKTVSVEEKNSAINRSSSNLAKVRFEILQSLKQTQNTETKLTQRWAKVDGESVFIMDSVGSIYVWKDDSPLPLLTEAGSEEWRQGLSLLPGEDRVQIKAPGEVHKAQAKDTIK